MSVVVLATGGTIESRRGSGAGIAPVGAADSAVARGFGPDVVTRSVMSVDSSTMTFERMAAIRSAVLLALEDPTVEGVVVLHGTDTLEETAMFLDLFHADPRPVVLTGAQRPADDIHPDGPSNIEFAIATARRTDSCGRGVVVAFGECVLPARGTRKAHTTRLDAYRHYLSASAGRQRATWPWHPGITDVRVDIIALYPGADRTHVDASAAAGAHGVVLEAMGSGNANPNILAAVGDCIDAGIRVVVTSRVPDGVIEPIYGGSGGGRDLIEAGAITSPWLRAAQARVLLASLIARGASHSRITAAFNDVVGLGAAAKHKVDSN